MKNVQIPFSLFFKLYGYFVYGNRKDEELIRQQLEEKYKKLCRHILYTSSKTSPTEEEREDAKKRYLDEVGVPESFRY